MRGRVWQSLRYAGGLATLRWMLVVSCKTIHEHGVGRAQGRLENLRYSRLESLRYAGGLATLRGIAIEMVN
jgi:hypothetical protein